MAAFLTLGLTFVITGTIWCLVLAWFAAAFSARLRGNAAVAALCNRMVGSALNFSRPPIGRSCPTLTWTKWNFAFLRDVFFSWPPDPLCHHAQVSV
jgi:hypothetical protein